MNKTELLKDLGLIDPFEGFAPNPDTKLWGWNGGAPIFGALVKELKPKLVIEVGSWMGQSACNIASTLKSEGLADTSALVCVDTWLGSLEHWQDPALKPHLQLRHGFPTFYYTYLSNVANFGVSDVVVPLPMPSSIAALYLKSAKVQADMLYVDGSHEQKDVYNDLEAYWPLVAPGGVLFGDDWPWDGVAAAVKAFSAEVGAPYTVHGGVFWMFRKRTV